MSGNQTAAGAVYAKIRAKLGRQLNTRDHDALLHCGTVSEIAAYLKQETPYAQELAGLQEAALHRDNLERLLRRHTVMEMAALCAFDQTVGEHFFEFFVIDLEVDELIAFLAFFTAGNPQQYLLEMSAVIDRISHINFSALTTAKRYSDLLEQLRNTRYARVLAAFAPENDELSPWSLPAIESALLKYRHAAQEELFRKQYSGAVRRDVQFLLNLRAELNDIGIVVRSKSFAQWSAPMLRASLVGARCLLSPAEFDDMVNAGSQKESLDIVLKSRYARYFERMQLDAFTYIDDFSQRILTYHANRLVRFSIQTPVAMFCLYVLRQTEVDNLTNIIEGVRYHIPMAQTQQLLIV